MQHICDDTFCHYQYTVYGIDYLKFLATINTMEERAKKNLDCEIARRDGLWEGIYGTVL